MQSFTLTNRLAQLTDKETGLSARQNLSWYVGVTYDNY
ncbi:uncharacterized protein METZ01_LOCUS472908 [marine metagenome]|uniref:Uncharacterized protein n=1 Tax=marine metagenome TaxID=408172 RepID=A0A383BJF6_9ZZZZ